MEKVIKPQASKGAEEILLTQIKQEFTTPADAISEYLELVEKNIEETGIKVEDEIEQIKSGCVRLIDQYEEAFVLNTGPNATQEKKTPEEYSELRHNLRTPLNAIIGYSEILIEDMEDDLSERKDFSKSMPDRVEKMAKSMNLWKSELIEPQWSEGIQWFDAHSKNHIRIINGALR